jgi:hypothetical protein
MPEDSKFDEFVRRETSRFVEPMTPPADAMWAAIAPEVARAIRPPAGAGWRRGLWLGIGVGLAAALVIGVGVGRWSATRPTSQVTAAATARVSVDDSLRAAAIADASIARYLGEAEVFLTAVRADLKAGRRDNDRAERSRQLLARTRLLLASGEPRSAAVDLLLRDLELMLAELSALPDSGRAIDEQLIEQRLRQGTILPRIRTTLPAQSAGL